MNHQAILQRHDPLCPAANAPCSCNLCDPYCTCDSLRAAYQRGREDAERDVFAAEALPFSNLLPRGVAAAAARGDGAE